MMKKKKSKQTTSIPAPEIAPQNKLLSLWKKYWKHIIGGLLVVVLLVFIVVFAVSELEALPVDTEGKVTVDDRNWLVKNIGTYNNPKYVSFGVVNPIEGYHLDHSDYLSDENEKYYFFAPDDEGSPFSQYYVMIATGDYQTLAQTTAQNILDYADVTETKEAVITKVAGRNVAYYTYYGGGTSEDSQETSLQNKSMNAYVPARDGYSYLYSIEQPLQTEEEALPDADFLALLEKILRN